MDALHERVLRTYCDIRQVHEDAVKSLARMKTMIGSKPDLVQAVDCIAVLKRAEELAKDLKAELAKTHGQLARVACALYMRSDLLGQPVRTDWISASPDAKSEAKLPKRHENLEDYTRMCEHFGVPMDAPFRPHWPDMVEYITQAENRGEEIPPGIGRDLLTTRYVVTCRWNKGVEPDALCQTLNDGDPYGKIHCISSGVGATSVPD